MTSSPTRTAAAAATTSKSGTNSSDHDTMTTPLSEESDSRANPAPVTPTNKPDVVSASNEDPSAAFSTSDADLVLGDLVAEGGFCSIYEVTGIKNLENEQWILQPPSTAEGSNKHHKRGGTGAFGSLGHLALAGMSTRRLQSGGHKRGASTSNLMHGARHEAASLPPLMKNVHLTVLTPFVHPAAADLALGVGSGASTSSSSPKKSLLRRSVSRDVEQKQQRIQKASPYVLKCLKPAVFGTPKVLDMGLKDMQIEIDTLQKLQHPHIISVLAHGTMELDELPMTASSPPKKQLTRRNPQAQLPQAYPFVILDRLGVTLEHKLEFWEAKHQKKSNLVGKLVTHRKHKKCHYLAHERWSVLRDMASALAYMHHQRIVYRDLKPENVAFDRHSDQLKLIDLGLAKDLNPLTPTRATGLYRLTALTGSARYMAPEVAREDDYNELCDVYGMAIVIWQVMALQTPYAKFNVQKMFQVVYDCPHVRPSLEEWKEEEDDSHRWMVRLLTKMWSPLIEERPTMKEVYAVLKRQVEKVEMETSQQFEEAS